MSKEEFYLDEVDFKTANSILESHHYLSKLGLCKKPKSGVNIGLFKKSNMSILGICIFTGFPVPELIKGCFGLDRNTQEGFFELSRLCLLPDIQKTEHNITSWFLSRAIKQLRKGYYTRALLSYSDTDHHEGTIYKACNFKYYGLTAKKKDFFIKQLDGSFKKHSRGPVKNLEGEWRDRSRKQRYLMVFDKTLNCLWEESNWNKN